jgi:hypothetical protein
MKRILLPSLIGSCLLFFSLAAIAENTPEPALNSFYSQDEYQNAHSMFDKIRSDLNAAQTDAYANDPGNAPRFDSAQNQLRTLEQNWYRGRYDSRELENTLSAVRTAVHDNRLMPHDRNTLDADVTRLLDFQTEYY